MNGNAEYNLNSSGGEMNLFGVAMETVEPMAEIRETADSMDESAQLAVNEGSEPLF